MKAEPLRWRRWGSGLSGLESHLRGLQRALGDAGEAPGNQVPQTRRKYELETEITQAGAYLSAYKKDRLSVWHTPRRWRVLEEVLFELTNFWDGDSCDAFYGSLYDAQEASLAYKIRVLRPTLGGFATPFTGDAKTDYGIWWRLHAPLFDEIDEIGRKGRLRNEGSDWDISWEAL